MLPPSEYRGLCRRCDREHALVNDVARASSTLQALFAELETDALAPERAALAASPGKMIGVLVAATGEVLRGHSGELGGRRDWPGWVGPVLRREDTAALEALTLARIAACDEAIAACDVEGAESRWRAAQLEATAARRAWASTRGEASREESRLLRQRANDVETAARQAFLDERGRLADWRARRRAASLKLSTALFDAAAVTSARGERLPLRSIFVGDRIAGGTTDCTVPKLLEAANVAGLRPVAVAEAWWGPTLNGRRHGEAQAPCERKCQPILGHLLCER